MMLVPRWTSILLTLYGAANTVVSRESSKAGIIFRECMSCGISIDVHGTQPYADISPTAFSHASGHFSSVC